MANTTKIRNMRTEHTASFYLQEAYYLARELEQMPVRCAGAQPDGG